MRIMANMNPPPALVPKIVPHILLSSCIHILTTLLTHRFLPPYSYTHRLPNISSPSFQSISIDASNGWLPTLANFDGLHFLYNQYTHLPNFAFLPAYSYLVQLAYYFMGEYVFVGIAVINGAAIGGAAVVLGSVCRGVGLQERAVLGCLMLFIYNPAAVFYHSVYSQSLFVLLTFTYTHLCLHKPPKTPNWPQLLLSLFLLLLSLLLRSTSLLLLPIIGLPILCSFMQCLYNRQIREALQWFGAGVMILFAVGAVFGTYLLWAYARVCGVEVEVGACGRGVFFNVYSYVQQQFWNVGVFRYYQSTNIAFILIGIPAIVLSLLMLHKPPTIEQLSIQLSFWILLVITILMTNLQSSTRFLSTHPAFYINAGIWALKTRQAMSNRNNKVWMLRWFIWKFYRAWQIFYFWMGFVLFTLEFPWT